MNDLIYIFCNLIVHNVSDGLFYEFHWQSVSWNGYKTLVSKITTAIKTFTTTMAQRMNSNSRSFRTCLVFNIAYNVLQPQSQEVRCYSVTTNKAHFSFADKITQSDTSTRRLFESSLAMTETDVSMTWRLLCFVFQQLSPKSFQ